MDWKPAYILRWLFDPKYGLRDRLIPRWLFLRALGLIYFSAFFSLVFQIRGLIGPHGILPAGEYLQGVAASLGSARFWYAPSLLWLSPGSPMLLALCWAGMLASLLIVLNVWPRAMLLLCFVCFLSFVSAASEFSGYQSDGMLLEAGFLSLFLAPPGFRPGLAAESTPIRASVLLLVWEWFRIYFESGIAKMASGDPEWRHFTAMDEYYQNGPLPTWIGWYVQHLPHWFHAATAFATLGLELVFVWTALLPRRFRIVCFFVVTFWQGGVILTANYTFLNYLVLSLGIFLLDDALLVSIVPERWRDSVRRVLAAAETENAPATTPEIQTSREAGAVQFARTQFTSLKLSLTAVILLWVFYAATVEMIWMIVPGVPFPVTPVSALQPFRIADRYGLFAYMTRGRYEIEFQGSSDGGNWISYPFRFKPQNPAEPPGIYAPYQPRFDWNLWFASLGGWRGNPIVPRTEERLLTGDRDVLALFAANPFPQPPRQVRAVLWQYWFTSMAEKRSTGIWWRRQSLGLYAPTLALRPDGKFEVVQWPSSETPRQ